MQTKLKQLVLPSMSPQSLKIIADKTKATGITIDEPSEFDIARTVICEKAKAAEWDLQMMSEEKKPTWRRKKAGQRLAS